MKIFLMRHGQTTGDIEDRFGGDYDDHLTELGRNQAQKLSSKIKNCGIEKIYSSPKIRAAQTASIINEKTGITVELLDDLRERNCYGVLTGKVKNDAKKEYPELVRALGDPKATIEGAEDYVLFKTRVLASFKKITDSNLEKIGIVTHGGVISCFLREVIKKERKELGDCSIIELDYDDGNYYLVKSEGVSF